MDSLLANYLSSGDLIVVHLCGQSKDLYVSKTHEYLGLTITDNGQGRAFVKKVKSDDETVEQMIKPGDHIAAINKRSTIGMRHYEVAKAIREVPQNTNFTLSLIEPQYSNHYLNADLDLKYSQFNESLTKRAQVSLLNFDDVNSKNSDTKSYVSSNSDLSCDDLINSSLPIDRLLSKRTTTEHNNSNGQVYNDDQDSYKSKIEKINSILESFLGISDNLLAIRIYRLARENKQSYSQFVSAFKTSELSVFNFDDDIQNFLWNCATGVVVQ